MSQKFFSPGFHLAFLLQFFVLFIFSSQKCGGFQHIENRTALKSSRNNIEMVTRMWNK